MPKSKPTGEMGFRTTMSGKQGRALIHAMSQKFMLAEELKNTEYSCVINIKGRSIIPEDALPSDEIRVTWTDNTKYLQVRGRSEIRAPIKDMFATVVQNYMALIVGDMPPNALGEVAQDLLDRIEVSGENPLWDAVLPKITGGGSSSGTSKAMPATHVKVPRPVVEKAEPFVDVVSELAREAYTHLAAYPQARDSLMRSLMRHGAQVKMESGSVVKKEQAEWIFIGSDEEAE
jgi:hypothetical protein